MKCDALQNLGEEKLTLIIRELLRGGCIKTIARRIQQDWQEAPGLSRIALERELTSLRLSIRDCGLTNDRSEPSTIPADGLQVSPVHVMTSLVQLQTTRINWLHKKELEQGKPLPALAQAIRDCGTMLPPLQEMRFDLGLDEYNRIKLTSREQQAAQEAKQRELYRQIQFAVEELDDVFRRRGITLKKKLQ